MQRTISKYNLEVSTHEHWLLRMAVTSLLEDLTKVEGSEFPYKYGLVKSDFRELEHIKLMLDSKS